MIASLLTNVLLPLALLGGLYRLCRLRRFLAGTTLTVAWAWLAAGAGVWLVTAIVTFVLELPGAAAADQLWYWTAVLMLCPPVAVLGARRPGASAWAVFVLVPLVLVMGWPTWTAWTQEWQLSRLELEVPAILGFAIVLLMGTGNYMATRFAGPALLYAATLLLLVLPQATATAGLVPAATTSRLLASWLLAGALLLIPTIYRRRQSTQPGFQRLWDDFADYFGVVWARRVAEAANLMGRREKWSVRIDHHRLAPVESNAANPADAATTADRMQKTIHRLLKRFVTPEWIDARLGSVEALAAEIAEVSNQEKLQSE